MSSDTLVTTTQLADHPDWRVFDCRHDLAAPGSGALAYARGHVPRALRADLDTDLSSAKTGRNGRHPMPQAEAFSAWLGRCGTTPADQIVAYDAADGAFAARLWWLLRAAGHRHVAVLDGGWARWQAEGRPVSTDVPSFAPSAYPVAWDARMMVDVSAVEANLSGQTFTVVDARAANRYRGENETIDPVAGHIPGALNRPYTQNLDARAGGFKLPEALKAEFAELLGQSDPATIVHQCGSGVTACHNLLAMEIAGLSGSRLFPGSWSQWCSDPARPVATGPAPI